MTREDFSFTSSDGLEVACYRWAAPVQTAGIVQIAHGMGEHALRYAHTAAFLANAGFHVYANDHRGHGRTARNHEALGDFGAGGWNALVADLAALSRIARERDRQLPLVLLGHSMGSFAAQQYILDHSALIAAVALSGSVAVDKLTFDHDRSVDLSSLNEAIADPRTPYDWLSRDPAAVDAYIADSALRVRRKSARGAGDGTGGAAPGRSGRVEAHPPRSADLHTCRRQGSVES